jgi:hypothetical protein
MNIKEIVSNFGKREELVYITVLLWIAAGIFGAYKLVSFSQLAAYFGSLTTYVATYVWAESKRPSLKTGVLQPGPSSRREIMIYFVVLVWAIAGAVGIQFGANLNDLAIYFIALTGFIASWIAGEVYKPEDEVAKAKTDIVE